MTGHLRGFLKRTCRIALKLNARNSISRLYRTGSGPSIALANALNGALKNEATQEEKEWVDRIESLRRELESNNTEIQFTDYGAGKPDLNLSDREMHSGRIITSTIANVCRHASTDYFWSFLLFKLIREFRPSVCLELGTCLGISASFQAAAL